MADPDPGAEHRSQSHLPGERERPRIGRPRRSELSEDHLPRRELTSAPRTSITIASAVIGIWGLAQAAPLLIPLLLASLLAMLLSPLLNRLRALRLPEPLALVVCALALLLPFSTLGYFILREIQALITDFPHILFSAKQTIAHAAAGDLVRRLLPQPIDLTSIAEKAAGQSAQAIQLALSALGTVLGAGSQLATVLLFTILILSARTNLRRSAGRLLRRKKNIEPEALLDEILDLLQLFLFSRFLIVGIVGAVDTAILFTGGIRYAILLGAFLGVATLIPAIGFIISMTPTLIVMVGMGFSFGRLALITGALIIVSIIESNVLTPKMVGHRMNINTLSIFIGLFAGGLLWGTWGMFLSIPVLGALRIALSKIPEFDDWGTLLAAREDRGLALRLRRRHPWHLRH